MAETREALGSAAANLQLEDSEVSGYRIHASVLPSTNIIRIDVQGRDGDRVSALANELVGIVAAKAKEMYRIFEMQPLEAALPARTPFHPDPARNAVIAGILGLFAGLLMTLLWESARNHDIRRRGDAPVSVRQGGADPDHATLWSEASISAETSATSGSLSRS
jgi:capsular polysaccharide biosynthesis protein